MTAVPGSSNRRLRRTLTLTWCLGQMSSLNPIRAPAGRGEGASLMRLHGFEGLGRSVGIQGHQNVKHGDGLRICLLCNYR